MENSIQELNARFTEFTTNSNWVKGEIDNYTFVAKLFDEGSEFGIKKGRVSKLSINLKNTSGFYGCVVNYDRGWDIRPKKDVKNIFNSVMNLLENAPERFK